MQYYAIRFIYFDYQLQCNLGGTAAYQHENLKKYGDRIKIITKI